MCLLALFSGLDAGWTDLTLHMQLCSSKELRQCELGTTVCVREKWTRLSAYLPCLHEGPTLTIQYGTYSHD